MRTSIYILFVSIILVWGCNSEVPDYFSFSGFAQGTTYSVIYDSGCDIEPDEMKRLVDTLLYKFDLSLSTYNPESLISKLNRGTEVAGDSLMLTVLKRSAEVWQLSDGAFDITMGPLINAWGFGPDSQNRFKEEMLDSLMQLVGMDKIVLDDTRVVKSDQRMFIDVNAIAQGYSVDVICKYLLTLGVERCLAEVGGEVGTVGSKYPDTAWQVAIDKPIDNNIIPGAEVQAVIKLNNNSLATSGNYRKFYEGDDGIKYSHTLDPKTGAPVQHNLLSATIISDDCMTADAFATACMVIGLEKAKVLIEKYDFLEGYLIYSDENGKLLTWYTENMVNYLSE